MSNEGTWAAKDGKVTECTNLYFDRMGEIRRLELNANAVLVQLRRHVDENENVTYSRIFSISCVDADMKDELMMEARRLMRSI